jgi:predicted glycosyltransferase involved in capsule biosynthesis
MENENFIGWGCEDNERIIRAKKLGMSLHRVPGNLYHLDHTRHERENFDNDNYKNNVKELNKVNKMSQEELATYIKTWNWTINE